MNATLKTAAAAIIVLGGGYIGTLAASYYSVRAAQIEQFIAALVQIEFNIGFLKIPASKALNLAANSRRGAVGRILKEVSEDMDRFKKPPPDAWREAMRRNKPSLCITGEDAEILIQFADNLGCGDVESERGNIRAACAKLELAERSAKAERDRMSRLLKGVGMLGGMLIAVLLL